jgi:dipeptidyl aminopeptidase/acylaminoacyl peptidase
MALCFLFAALLSPAFAKKEDPLRRVVPVPASEPIPVMDFFRPRIFDSPELNPAGTHFAALVSSRDDRIDLLAYELATKKVERLSGGGSFDVRRFDWLGDRRLVFSVIRDKRYTAGWFAAELGKFNESYVLQRFSVMSPVGFPKNSPMQIIAWIRQSAQNHGADGGLVRIDTRETFKGGLLGERMFSSSVDEGLRADVVDTYPSPKGGDVVRYMVDREGELAFAVTREDGVSTLHRWAQKRWERCVFDFDEMSITGVGDVPGELLVCVAKEKGKPDALYRYDTGTGTLGELIFQDEKYDMTGASLYRHPVDRRLLGIRYRRKGTQSVWFDRRYTEIQNLMQASFPGEVVRIIGSDREEKKFFVSVYSDVRPAAYYYFNVDDNTAAPVADVTPWIDPKRMQPMRVIAYKTRDGHEIEAYLTLPAGASKESPAPLVVLPHGGPWARDGWGWDAEVQFLVSRGYAVFQPNYRGSTGYGWRFPEEDMWAFRKMHDDVTDGVKTILKTGLIDRDRIAIMGASFGGYLALCGAVYENDLYRCAITVAGVFDWERVMKEARGSEYLRSRFGVLRRFLGDPQKNQAKFDEISPARHVDQIKIPVFVAHGTEDVVASVAQSKRLIADLKKHRVPYEKQIEREEGHGFQKLENKVELYTAIEAFLAKHLAPRSKPVDAPATATTAALTR